MSSTRRNRDPKVNTTGAKHPKTPEHKSSQKTQPKPPKDTSAEEKAPIHKVGDLLQGMREFPATKWFELGVHLGVAKTDLDNIHSDKSLQSGVERCKLEMLDKWFKSSKDTPTWAKVYDALCAVKEKRLAVQIATNYELSPKISNKPMCKYVHLGESVEFCCIATGIDPLQYRWSGPELTTRLTDGGKTLRISTVTRKNEGKYKCAVKNRFLDTPAILEHTLIIGEVVNEKTMCDVLESSGVRCADWGEIGVKLEVDPQMLGDVFFEGWKKFDSHLTWEKLASGLEKVPGTCYRGAVVKCRNNAGKELSETNWCMFVEEARLKSSDYMDVAKKLGFKLEGRFSANDFCKEWGADASWEKLGEALGTIEEYKDKSQNLKEKVAEKGLELNESTISQALNDIGIQEPDWKQIGEIILKKPLKGHVSPSEFYKKWSRNAKSHLSWAALSDALGQTGNLAAAEMARIKEGKMLTANTVYDVISADVTEINWEDIICQLRLPIQINQVCLSELLKKWTDKKSLMKPWNVWRKLSSAIERMENYGPEVGQKVREASGVELVLNEVNMTWVLSEAGIHDESKRVLAKHLGLSDSLVNQIWGYFSSKVRQLVQHSKDPQEEERRYWSNVLKTLHEEKTQISWEKLAQIIENIQNFKNAVQMSQTVRELSGAGGQPCITSIKPRDCILKEATGRRVCLQIEATGAPQLNFTWLHNGEIIRGENSNRLDFKSVKAINRGKYKCRIENEFGFAISEPAIELIVGESPHGVHISAEQENVVKGSKLELKCEALGMPPFNYKWSRNTTTLTDVDGHTLEISKATEEDEGIYMCTVTNEFDKNGCTSNQLKISVGEPPLITKVDTDGAKRRYQPEEKVSFYCEATGVKLKYTWLQDEKELREQRQQTLTIKKAKQDTGGAYQCCVSNPFGEVKSEIIKITVGERPIIKVHPVAPSRVTSLGQHWKLTCESTGELPLKFVWLHNNISLSEKTAAITSQTKERDGIRRGTSDLSIKAVNESHQGTYHCHVTNTFGFAKSESVELKLSITWQELVSVIAYAPFFVQRWYMVGVLLRVHKSQLDRISRSFLKHRNVNLACDEVLEAWLNGEIFYPETEKVELPDPRNWHTLHGAIVRMGERELAQRVYRTHLRSSSTSKDQETTHELNGKLEKHRDSELDDEKLNTQQMIRKFRDLTQKLKDSLTKSEADGIPTDEGISGCQAYLRLIDFSEQDVEKVTDISSLFKMLEDYLNFHRYHLLEMVASQFDCSEAKQRLNNFLEKFKMYEANTPLDDIASNRKEDLQVPGFMRPFNVILESVWASCTLKDFHSLLKSLLPESVSDTFVWFSTAYRIKPNYICLEYYISKSLANNMRLEAERKQGVLQCGSILRLCVDGFTIEHMEKPKLKPKTAKLSTSGAAVPEHKLLLLNEEPSEISFKDTHHKTELPHQLKQKEEAELKDIDELKRLETQLLELNSEVKKLMTRFDQHQNKQKENDDQHKKDFSKQVQDLHEKVLTEQKKRQEDQKTLTIRVSKIQDNIQDIVSKSQETVHQTVSKVQETVQQKVSKSDVRDILKAEVSEFRKNMTAATQEMLENSERKLREELSRQHDQREKKQLKALEATVVPQIQQCQAEINRLKQELQYESRLRSLEERFEQLNK